MIKMYDEDPNSQKNIYNNLARVNRIEPNNVSHYVVGYKCTPEKSYLKIRTNPDNPIIINSIIAGRRPGFSIRTKGDFQPGENGTMVASGLEFITIDYVSNPANVTSVAIPEMKAVNPLEGKEVELELLPKTGTESFASNLKPGEKLMYDPNLTGMESLANMYIVTPVEEDKTLDFNKSFELALHSF